MKLKHFGFLLPISLIILASCMKGDDFDYTYSEWRQKNTDYITAAEAATENGEKVYQKIVPTWDKASFTLVKWHTRGTTGSLLTPLSNSTIDVVYLLRSIEGDTIDSSYSQTVFGDSIYRCRPCDLITGFQIASTSMNVGDSVTAIIPYWSGYGVNGSGSVLPFSTLIFEIKLKQIVAYDYNPD